MTRKISWFYFSELADKTKQVVTLNIHESPTYVAYVLLIERKEQ